MSTSVKYEPVPSGEDGVTDAKKQFSVAWRAINAVMGVFFLLAGLVQLNDPDPFIWVPIYVIPAGICMAISANPNITANVIWQWVAVIHLSLSLAGVTYTLSLLVYVMDKKIYNPLQEEEGRELGGLLIVVFWLYLCRFTSCGSAIPHKGTGSSLLVISVIVGLFPLLFWGLCFIDTFEKKLGHCKDMFPGIMSIGSH